MTGTITLYDKAGQRRHTIYVGATPEHGKATFLARMEREIDHVERLYPQAKYVGLADGAPCNWKFLQKHTQLQVLDFWHAAQCLSNVAQAVFPRDAAERERWLEARCHDLKHYPGAAERLLKEMEASLPQDCPKAAREPPQRAAGYFRRHNTASAPSKLQRALPHSMRSLTRWRQAPSTTPVAIGQPSRNAAA